METVVVTVWTVNNVASQILNSPKKEGMLTQCKYSLIL